MHTFLITACLLAAVVVAQTPVQHSGSGASISNANPQISHHSTSGNDQSIEAAAIPEDSNNTPQRASVDGVSSGLSDSAASLSIIADANQEANNAPPSRPSLDNVESSPQALYPYLAPVLHAQQAVDPAPQATQASEAQRAPAAAATASPHLVEPLPNLQVSPTVPLSPPGFTTTPGTTFITTVTRTISTVSTTTSTRSMPTNGTPPAYSGGVKVQSSVAPTVMFTAIVFSYLLL